MTVCQIVKDSKAADSWRMLSAVNEEAAIN